MTEQESQTKNPSQMKKHDFFIKANESLAFSSNEERLYITDLPLITVGEFVSGDGTRINFTEEFLKQSADYNNGQFPDRIPYLILGHIDETVALMYDYVYGDVREFEYRDGTLYAKKCPIFKAKEEEVKSGKLQGVSVRIAMETGEIEHVACVGRQAIPKANINNAKLEIFEICKNEELGGTMSKVDTETIVKTVDFEAKAFELEQKVKDYEERMRKIEEENKKVKAVSFIKENQSEGKILESQVEIVAKMFTSESVEEVLEHFGEFIALNQKVDFSKAITGTENFKQYDPAKTVAEITDDIIEGAKQSIKKAVNK